MRRSRVSAAIGLAVASVTVLAGCSAGSPAASAAPTVAAAALSVKPPAGSAAACVPDPQKVATSKNEQSTKPMSAALAAKYNAAVQAVYEKVEVAAPSAIVGVRTPQGTWEKAYGVADLATGAPTTTDMYQRIGSVTKTFVATAVLQLANEHKLSLDDPIDDYVAGVPNGTRITLRELITMTSGLPEYGTSADFVRELLANPARSFTRQQILDLAYAMPTSFPPGTSWQYSNTNYVLLGLAIEHVTGKPLQTVLADQILKPLHLGHTTLPTGAAFPSPHPQGMAHFTDTASPLLGTEPTGVADNTTDWNPSWAWAAGAMTSRMGDLLTWVRALATGQGVLPAATQVQRLSSFGTTGLDSEKFYSEGLGCLNGWLGHTGSIPGYNTNVVYEPSIQATVVVETTGDLVAPGTLSHAPAMEYLTSAAAAVAGHPYPAGRTPTPPTDNELDNNG